MSAELHIAEGSQLAHAIVAHALSSHGIRALFVKGPVATSQGLRSDRISNDVDVLCDPARMKDAIELFESFGWTRYAGEDTDPMAIGMHASTYCIPGWPNTIDLHANFPGLLAPPSESFAFLWERRRVARMAHHALAAPAPADHFVIIAVHHLRELPEEFAHSARLPLDLAWRSLSPHEQRDAVAAARALGALEPLRAVFVDLGADPGPYDERYAAEARTWQRSRRHLGDSSMVWLIRWQGARWRDRPELVARAFWDISMDSSRTPQEWAAATRRERARGRLRRTRRGLAGIPRALRGARAAAREGNPAPRHTDSDEGGHTGHA